MQEPPDQTYKQPSDRRVRAVLSGDRYDRTPDTMVDILSKTAVRPILNGDTEVI